MSFRVLEIPSPEAIYAQDVLGLWASHNGVILPFGGSQAHSASSTVTVGIPLSPQKMEKNHPSSVPPTDKVWLLMDFQR